jgi:hypothetical protein
MARNVGETMFPPRAPFFNVLLNVSRAWASQALLAAPPLRYRP